MTTLRNDNGNYTLDTITSGAIWEGEMSHDAWVEKYKPIDNHLNKYADKQFETYGADKEFVQDQDAENVWTWVTGDNADLLLPGFHYVNRFAFFVCEEPWTEEDQQVLISVEIECECFDQDKWDEGADAGDPDCQKCEGYGLRAEYL
jgi:hypothetical protein